MVHRPPMDLCRNITYALALARANRENMPTGAQGSEKEKKREREEGEKQFVSVRVREEGARMLARMHRARVYIRIRTDNIIDFSRGAFIIPAAIIAAHGEIRDKYFEVNNR